MIEQSRHLFAFFPEPPKSRHPGPPLYAQLADVLIVGMAMASRASSTATAGKRMAWWNLLNFPNKPRGVSGHYRIWLYIMRNYTRSAHDRILPNGNSCKNCGTRANPCSCANMDGFACDDLSLRQIMIIA